MGTLYLEPFGGMAGDMLLAALLDLEQASFTLDHLRELAEALVPGACTLAREEVRAGAFRASRLHLRTPEGDHPPTRHLADLLALVGKSPLDARGKGTAGAVLGRLARAEARVHGVGIEEVHFHEVGAVDTLVDVCGAIHALDLLGVDEVRASVPYLGGGQIAGAHGTMPVPAPGTAEILRGLPGRHGEGGERVTPTGAALLAELATEVGGTFAFTPRAIGYGTGTRECTTGPPNLLRVQLGDRLGGAPGRRTAHLLECNLDDTTGEEVGFLLGALRGAGALEAWSAAVQMKKDRPGVVVSALCRAETRAALEAVVFLHSPSLGVRWSETERTECGRELLEVELAGEFAGRVVRVKRRLRPGGGSPASGFDLSPEYDDLALLARETGRSLRELEALVLAAARRRVEN